MPNWVKSRIEISGDEKEIKKFEDEVINFNEGEEERVFSFQSILKRPEELDNTIAPNPKPIVRKIKDNQGNEIESLEYRYLINEWEINAAIQRGETPPEPIVCNNATSKQQEELLNKFGRSNWYDWNLHNWGTKWDVAESSYDKEEKVLEFQTAWSCPEEILIKLVEKFPQLQFEGIYADEDWGSNAGYINSDGTIEALENQCDQAKNIAKMLWNFEEDEDEE
jgi:hypothetical protein